VMTFSVLEVLGTSGSNARALLAASFAAPQDGSNRHYAMLHVRNVIIHSKWACKDLRISVGGSYCTYEQIPESPAQTTN
jgi:hypothetical protein